MMAIMVESAGAQKGYLFQEDKGALILKAGSSADGLAQAGAPEFPERVVNYVMRTGECVVMGESTSEVRGTPIGALLGDLAALRHGRRQ